MLEEEGKFVTGKLGEKLFLGNPFNKAKVLSRCVINTSDVNHISDGACLTSQDLKSRFLREVQCVIKACVEFVISRDGKFAVFGLDGL